MEKKKLSLFAQQMKIKRLELPDGPVVMDKIIEKSDFEVFSLESVSYLSQITGFPVSQKLINAEVPVLESKTFKTSEELLSVHEENLCKIQKMSKEEVESSLQEINSLVNPSTIEVLRRRGQKKLKNMQKTEKPSTADLSESDL